MDWVVRLRALKRTGGDVEAESRFDKRINGFGVLRGWGLRILVVDGSRG